MTDLAAIGTLPGHIRAWALALSAETGVSFEFALFTLLSAMASATCGLKVVKRPDGGSESTSLIVFAQAPSGYGKTRLYKRAFRAHQMMDANRLAMFLSNNMASKPMSRGQGANKAAATDQRLRLNSLQSCTKSGLLEALLGVGEAVSMSAHEGNLILSSGLFRNDGLEMVTTLWDGDGTIQTSRWGHTQIAMNATLNMLVMVQGDVFDDYRKEHGKHARGIGFFGRSMWISAQVRDGNMPCAMQTDDSCLLQYEAKVEALLTRKLEVLLGSKPATKTNMATPDMHAFVAKVMAEIGYNYAASVTELEAERAPSCGVGMRPKPEVMELDADATRAYFDLERQLEHRWSSCGFMRDAVGRAMQNVLRIAGVMQAFDNDRASIPANVLHSAYQIVEHSLGQFSLVFPPESVTVNSVVSIRPIKLSVQERAAQRIREDSQTILGVISSLCQLRKEEVVPLSDVRERCAIYALRFRAALAMLADEKRVEFTGAGRDRRVSVASFHGRAEPPLLFGTRL